MRSSDSHRSQRSTLYDRKSEQTTTVRVHWVRKRFCGANSTAHSGPGIVLRSIAAACLSVQSAQQRPRCDATAKMASTHRAERTQRISFCGRFEISASSELAVVSCLAPRDRTWRPRVSTFLLVSLVGLFWILLDLQLVRSENIDSQSESLRHSHLRTSFCIVFFVVFSYRSTRKSSSSIAYAWHIISRTSMGLLAL